MISQTSRYFGTGVALLVTPSGKQINYLRRRFIPNPDTGSVLSMHTVTEGERLDIITARHLGNPELFWRVSDVNYSMRPEELTKKIGQKLRIPMITGG
jgi:hypothetical protein